MKLRGKAIARFFRVRGDLEREACNGWDTSRVPLATHGMHSDHGAATNHNMVVVLARDLSQPEFRT